MARYSEQLVAEKDRQHRPTQKNQGQHPRRVSKAKAQSPLRRSARLNSQRNVHAQNQHCLPANKSLCEEGRLTTPQSGNRKRSRGVENPVEDTPTLPLQKRPRITPGFDVGNADPSHSKPQQDTSYPECGKGLSPSLNSRKRHQEHPAATELSQKRFQHYPKSPYVAHWVIEETWPRETFESGFFQLDNMLLARKKPPSLRRKRSESSITSEIPSEQKPRETKATPYAHRSYPTWLKTQGVYMENSTLGISDESKRLCQSLLKTKCDTPKDSLFRDDIFEEAIDDLQDKNESRIIQDIGRLLVPSARTLARLSEKHLRILVESVNEGWECCIPLTDPRPQPDYAVGFGRPSLSDGRIEKLRPLIAHDPSYQSPLMATHYMYFPILTSEVKCGTAGLELADRQNAHSMGIAVRAIVSIFQLVKRESELHRELLTFSVSHDHRTVRLHGWYPIFEGNTYKVHRHLVHAFDITALEGREKWTAFRFSRGVYERAIILLEKINTIVDRLPPDLNLGGPQPHRLQNSGPSGLSQEFGELLSEDTVDLQQVTPDTSPQETRASKKKKC